MGKVYNTSKAPFRLRAHVEQFVIIGKFNSSDRTYTPLIKGTLKTANEIDPVTVLLWQVDS